MIKGRTLTLWQFGDKSFCQSGKNPPHTVSHLSLGGGGGGGVLQLTGALYDSHDSFSLSSKFASVFNSILFFNLLFCNLFIFVK